MFSIHDYLADYDKKSNRGKCRGCSLTVRWNRERLASHKRVKCSGATRDEKEFFRKFTPNEIKNILYNTSSSHENENSFFSVDMSEDPALVDENSKEDPVDDENFKEDPVDDENSKNDPADDENSKNDPADDENSNYNSDEKISGTIFKIGDYLRDFKKQTSRGTCKACEKSVRWNMERLGSHKRANCAEATLEEKEFFRSQIISKESKVSKLSVSGDNISSIYKTRESSRLSAKCFSCNSLLGSCRIPLNFTTEVSESSLAEVLETTTGLEISETVKSEEALCNRCYLLVEKFDDLKARSKIIEEKLVEMLQQKQTEHVYIKEEPEEYFEVNCFKNSVECDFNPNSEENDDDDEWPDESIANRPMIENKSSSTVIKEDLPEMSKNNYCVDCSREFKNNLCLRAHWATDHDRNEVDIECPTCLKIYQNQKTFKDHFREHEKSRSFLCGQCGKTFSRPSTFKIHMMIHDDIRPFKCTFPGCTSRFLDSIKLKRHLVVHTGEKNFECPHCPDKRFAQKRAMDLHIKNHHSTNIVKRLCKICRLQVPASKMKLHLKQHRS